MSKDTELSHYLSCHPDDLNISKATQLIKAGASANTVNFFGDNLLHVAVYKGQIEDIQITLTTGIDVNMTNRFGQTALHCLLNHTPCNLDAVFLLIRAGASPNTTNQYSENILHLAVTSRKLSYIREAMIVGANLHNINSQGHSPLFCLMNQKPVNLEACALFVFACVAQSAGEPSHRYLPSLSLLPSPKAYSSNESAPELILNRVVLENIAKYHLAKERALQFIKSTSVGIQRGLINQGLDEMTALGAFFSTQRGFLQTSRTSGTKRELLKMKDKLNALPTLLKNRYSATLPDTRPSAPPLDSLPSSSSIPGPQFFIGTYPGMNPSSNYLTSQQQYSPK